MVGATALVCAAMSTSGVAAQDGRALYETHCLVCHQADGGGVPMMQPELWQSPRINGEADDLIRFVLQGTVDFAPEDRAYPNAMPGFSYVNDRDLAAILTYIRSNFDNDAPEITANDVAAVRTP